MNILPFWYTTCRKAAGFIPYAVAVCSLSLILLSPQTVDAGPDWQISLRVESGNAYNRLVFGANSTATDGYDKIWDTYALMGGDLEAFFPHPEWGLVHQDFHRDIRALAPDQTSQWPLTVQSTLVNNNFTINWDLSDVPGGYPAVLVDNATGQATDMRSTASYDFLYTGERSFQISVTEASPCANPPVRIVGSSNPYSKIQDAYAASVNGDIIQSHANVFVENLNMNRGVFVTLRGGFNCDFTARNGSSTVYGSLSTSASSGTVTVEDIILK